jgi:hypothetical protein
MGNFKDTNEMLTFAKDFIDERIRALEKDAKHCVTPPYAPIPAISYCFSTINLLAELSIRKRIGHDRDSDYQTQTYMQTYMKYNPDQTELLMQIFRHKVAHLAIPNPIYIDSHGRSVTWVYWHGSEPIHLMLEQLSPNSQLTITSCWKIPCDYVFHLSIMQFVNDIKKSVDDGAGNGYLVELQKSTHLQYRFQTALCEIYQS